MRIWVATFLICGALGRPQWLAAQSPWAAIFPAPSANVNLPWKTLGGEQFWTDELVYGGWRVQQNALTGHFRLLDPADVRRAWGTQDQCRDAFEQAKRREKLPPLGGRALVTLHGLGRSRHHMDALGAYLAEQSRCTWVNVSYASTRHSLDEHAASLARVLAGLEGIEEIDFVCHSLGNLVVRRYLGEATQPSPRWQPDPRIRRMVMLGPPNNGARIATLVAEVLHDNELAKYLAGPSAWTLAREWQEVQGRLATPPFEFAILAGGCGDDCGLNPLLTGDDDLIVCVDETKLAGARDFRVVNCRHGALMGHPQVQQYALNFIVQGCFTTEGERQPIVAVGATAPEAAPR